MRWQSVSLKDFVAGFLVTCLTNVCTVQFVGLVQYVYSSCKLVINVQNMYHVVQGAQHRSGGIISISSFSACRLSG